MKKLVLSALVVISVSLFGQESIDEIQRTQWTLPDDDLFLLIDVMEAKFSTKSYNVQLENKAQEGNSAAQNLVGLYYLNGNGVTQDYKKAKYWLEKSVQQNNPKGLCTLGYMYEFGLGVDMDKSKAVELYRKSALIGFPMAWINLASCYEEGKGVQTDLLRARAWWEKAARYGYRMAQIRLAQILYNTDENYHDALYWVWRAAKQKSPGAFYIISECYKDGIFVEKSATMSLLAQQQYYNLNKNNMSDSEARDNEDSSLDNVDVSSFTDAQIVQMIDGLFK